VRLTTPHLKTLLLRNLNRGGQGPIWAVAPVDGWIFSIRHYLACQSWNATISVSKKASQSNQISYYCKAVQWFRSLVAGLSSRKPTFASGSIYVGFVVDEVTQGQVFLRNIQSFLVNIMGGWTKVVVLDAHFHRD